MNIDYSWVPAATILLGEHGSRGNGTSTAESDHDLTGICAEPRRFVTGLQAFGSKRFNSVGEGNRSGADDMDSNVFGLRRWAALASAGSPNALLPLFMDKYEILTPAGQILIDNRQAFLSANLIDRYLGFVQNMRQLVLGAKTIHPELVAQYGFDTKAATSMLIAGIHGLSLVRDRSMTLPLREDDKALVARVRTGRVDAEAVLAAADDLVRRIHAAAERSALPERTDGESIDRVLDEAYEVAWAQEPVTGLKQLAATFFPSRPKIGLSQQIVCNS